MAGRGKRRTDGGAQAELCFDGAPLEARRVVRPPAGRIALHYSNHTERLLDALVEHLAEERGRPGAALFDPAHVIVPNRSVEAWLKFGIARAAGIAAHLEVRYLRSFLAERVAAVEGGRTRLLDGACLEGLLIEALHDDAIVERTDLAPVRDFLFPDGRPGDEEARDRADRRRCQLASRLARLFEEYGYARGEMLATWPRGCVLDGRGDFSATERWQRALWLALFGAGGVAERRGDGAEWLTVGGLVEAIAAGRLPLPPTLHVFGVSYVARAFQDVFAALAHRCHLRLYAINPCLEFWEDVKSERERARDRLPRHDERVGRALLDEEDPFSLDRPGDTPALRLWGRPGRENVRLLNELCDCDFSADFEDPLARGPSLLHRLQADILARAPEREAPDEASLSADDGSIVALACPGVRRELEVIAGEIWRLVAADEERAPGEPPLRWNDVAVILPAGPDQAAYQAHVGSVFRETRGLPHHVVDLPATGTSRVVEALGLLLALPFSRFTRQEVLRAATHPSVIAGLDGADPEAWADRCEELGIAHGADHGDHAGTYIARDVLNWDQGLRRLALGAFMAGRRSGDASVEALGDGERYAPAELSSGAAESAAGLGLLVRSLIADARFARRERLPMARWIEWLQALVSGYLHASDEEDERMVLRCRQGIDGLAALGLGDRPLSYRVPYELLTAALAELCAERGQYLADGVVVSSFLPMRAIPFRVIFIAGLGEGRFPSREARGRLDLRLARRRAGDVTAREQDKYMFLETLLCARDRLYLSWVARDALTGDDREPSSVVRELGHILDGGYLGPGGFGKRIRRHPLRRFDEPPEIVLPPAARREAQARALGAHLRAALGRPPRDLAELRRELPAATFHALADRLGLALPPSVERVAPADEVVTIPLRAAALRRFLEDPLQGAARAALGLRDDDEDDPASREDERFEPEPLRRVGLLRAVFLETLAAGAPSDEAAFARAAAARWDGAADLLERDGALPTGPFKDAARRRDLAVLRGWWQALRAIAPHAPLAPGAVRFGRADEAGAASVVADPVVLDGLVIGGRRARIELSGRTEPLVAEPCGSLILVTRRDRKERTQKDGLRAFVDALLLAASGRQSGSHRALVDNCPPGGEARVAGDAFSPITEREARDCLAALATDLLDGVHDYLLPCEAVFAGGDLVGAIEAMRADDRGRYSFDYGPIKDPRRYAPPDAARAEAMVRRRFGLYLDCRRAVEEAR